MPTKIEWAEESLNIATGCTKVSDGCKNCYAEKMSKRLKAMGQSKYFDVTNDDGRWSGKVRFHGDVLSVPEKWRNPRRVFLNSMSDTFHGELDDTHIYKMLQMVVDNPKHTFIVATKRVWQAMRFINYFCSFRDGNPIPNLWLLASVENQKVADERIPHLLKTNVVVHGLSMEPLLGHVDPFSVDGDIAMAVSDFSLAYPVDLIDWVIVGGESGPGGRPMHPDWARSIRDACVQAEIPFFFKQWGKFLPLCQVQNRHDDDDFMEMIGNVPYGRQWAGDGFPDMFDIGKKKAGRVLDGRTWDEYPVIKAVKND